MVGRVGWKGERKGENGTWRIKKVNRKAAVCSLAKQTSLLGEGNPWLEVVKWPGICPPSPQGDLSISVPGFRSLVSGLVWQYLGYDRPHHLTVTFGKGVSLMCGMVGLVRNSNVAILFSGHLPG